jgi:predicted DNA-binding transcriptional regulator AlpA
VARVRRRGAGGPWTRRGFEGRSIDYGLSRNEATDMADDPDLDSALLTNPLMKAEEVAALLAVRPSTVYELSRRASDPLPSVSIGRSKRFDARAVAQWVSAHSNR